MKALFAALCLFASTAHAETSPRLSQGNWIVGGSTSLQFQSNSSTYFTIAPELEYFIADKVAVGASLSYSVVGSQSSFFGSPEITVHTKMSETVVPYLTVKPFEVGNYTGGGTYYTSAGLIGIKFFLSDSVAFGPAFEGRHYWPVNGTGAGNIGKILGVFSMHI